jgi:hypothetical protein
MLSTVLGYLVFKGDLFTIKGGPNPGPRQGPCAESGKIVSGTASPYITSGGGGEGDREFGFYRGCWTVNLMCFSISYRWKRF